MDQEYSSTCNIPTLQHAAALIHAKGVQPKPFTETMYDQNQQEGQGKGCLVKSEAATEFATTLALQDLQNCRDGRQKAWVSLLLDFR